MGPLDGRCPSCAGTGDAGQPCQVVVCRNKGFHYIPDHNYDKYAAQPVVKRDPLIGRLIGDYLIVDQLGRGAYGQVYTVLLLPLYMPAALKLLSYNTDNPETRDNVLQKFEGEALSLAHLHHPNLVRLLKYGIFDGKPYIVMEYVKSGHGLDVEIAMRLEDRQPFESRLIRHICEQMLNALNAAHQAQIVHRDIKPSNVLLQQVSGDNYFVRVLDFGLAKFIDDGGDTSYIVGTPYYMAPEQVMRRNIGPWTDLYGVGMIALEMLLGERIDMGEDADSVMIKKRSPAFDPLSQVPPGLMPPSLRGFFRKALAWRAEDRYSDAEAFKSALVEAFRRHEREQHSEDSSFDSFAELQRIQLERVQLTRERNLFDRQRRELEKERRSLQEMRDAIESRGHSGNRTGLPPLSKPTRNWPWILLLVCATLATVAMIWGVARCS